MIAKTPHNVIRVRGFPSCLPMKTMYECDIIRAPNVQSIPAAGKAPGLAIAQTVSTASMKLKFHNLRSPESLILAPISDKPSKRAARFIPIPPCLTLTETCWKTRIPIQIARSHCSIVIGIKSEDIRRFSASVANINNHIQGANTATPAIEGESLLRAKNANPPQTKPWEISRVLAPLPASSAGINRVRRITIAIPPIHKTWSETTV